MSLLSRAKALCRLIFLDPGALWVGLATPAVALFLAWRLAFWPGELRIRVAGYVVTLAGVFFVIKNLLGKGRIFDVPALRIRFVNWRKRFPPIFARRAGKNYVIGAEAGAFAVTGGSGRISFSGRDKLPLQERVATLEQSLDLVEIRLDGTVARFEAEMRALRSEHAEERVARDAEHRRLHDKLEDLSIGALDYEMAGVFWVVIGNLFTTFPGEVASLCQR